MSHSLALLPSLALVDAAHALLFCCLTARWHNQLDPSLNRTPLSPHEETLILQLYNEHGSKWAKIARSLPGR